MNLPALQSAPHDIDTPALCVDLDRMEANIGHMVACCRQHKIDWRPHSKCHKSPAIAQKLVAAGAIGVTCAKVGEAEVMAAAGVTDLLIANQIVGAQTIWHFPISRTLSLTLVRALGNTLARDC